VPEEWISTVQAVRTKADFCRIRPRLPEEAAERLYAVGLGEKVTPPARIDSQANVAANPDNLRRFAIVEDSDEMMSLLTQPFENWLLYLHPTQRDLAQASTLGEEGKTGPRNYLQQASVRGHSAANEAPLLTGGAGPDPRQHG
jgi:hypothetical protein